MRFLKNIVESLPYPLLRELFDLKYSVTTAARAQLAAEALRIRPTRIETLLNLKQSDTLVFLGGGPSINLIPDSFWQAIRPYDTVGVNFWLIHPFVPRLYFVEAIERSKPATDPYERLGFVHYDDPYDMFRVYRELALERESDYLEVPKFITGLGDIRGKPISPLPLSWLSTTSHLHVTPVPARSAEELKRGLGQLIKGGVFKPLNTTFFKQASTLSLLIGFAARLGYKRILLCGVDLKNNQYFYQNHELYPKWALFGYRSPGPYPTTVPMKWQVPIQDVVMVLKELVLDPAGIQIFVQNRDSLLFPQIPEMPPDFLEDSSSSPVKPSSGGHLSVNDSQ